MPENNNNVPNENEVIELPSTGVITDIKFGANGEPYEIGLGESTREALIAMFDAVDDNFTILNTTIEDNEEVVSNALNDLEERKAEKTDVPVVPTNVSAFTNDAGYLTQQSLSNYYDKDDIDDTEKTIASALNDLDERKLDSADLPTDLSDFRNDVGYFNNVAYDSDTKHINFKDGNTTLAYVDATAFIKDGMVSNVTTGNVTIDNVSTPCLIITFNTDAGKEPINIPLSTFFNASNYYTKDEIDEDGKVISSALNDLDERKADKEDITDYFDDVAYDSTTNRINFKNGNTVKKYLDTTQIFDPDDYYVKDDVDDADKVVSSALNDLNERLGDKADISDLAVVATSGSYNDLTDKPLLPVVTDEITENSTAVITSGAIYSNVAENEWIISSALTDLDDRKADKEDVPNFVSDLPNDAGYLTSSDVVQKADRIPIVNQGTTNTTFTLDPNIFYQWGVVTSLSLTLYPGEAGYLSEYMFEFQSGSTPTTLSLPNTVKWPAQPTVAANMIYQVTIVNNIGLIVGVSST